MADHTLIIKRSGNNLSVKVVQGGGEIGASKFHIDPNEDPNVTLCWQCDGGEFAVLFANDRSPFSSGRKAHCAHQGATTARLKIRNLKRAEQHEDPTDAEAGATFKYGVAVLHPTTGEVLTLDPDIIIDDPGGDDDN